jgi:predicted DNA-binding transcriptional regulator AlpA
VEGGVMKLANNYPPRGLRAEQAATYLGMGMTKFLELVEAGRLPRPRAVDGMRIWDRCALDAAFDDFAEHGDKGRPNSFDQVLGGL